MGKLPEAMLTSSNLEQTGQTIGGEESTVDLVRDRIVAKWNDLKTFCCRRRKSLTSREFVYLNAERKQWIEEKVLFVSVVFAGTNGLTESFAVDAVSHLPHKNLCT